MNKEVPLKERIEKLYESGYVNEFNYLENQLQEARYLVTILHKQTEEKDKEIERLKENWKELKEIIQEQINNPLNVEMKIFSKMVLNDMETIERIERR